MGSVKNEAIAIIGSACRFPGNADSPSKLWEVLRDPKDLGGPLPSSRFNAAGFYHRSPAYHGHSNVHDMKSYFLSEQSIESRFDAAFFGINPAEASALDPQVRLVLETTYEALEAAGQTMESLQGSDTGCYVGLMMGEYEVSMLRDPETISKYHITGTARSLISNRLSYFFDWHGPSMTIDTACSSSLVAVHQSVQLLRSHQARLAVAAGSNLILDPINHVGESKLQMLSPDGRGRMWDAGANGYARGEGVATLVLKRLSDAIKDGDHIECIIRETGVNQDGKTRGITMPSSKAQAALIRETYRNAGLDLASPYDRPQYFEAHGTGTPAGDPIEAEAIHSAFFGDSVQNGESSHQPLVVGSIKTVLGHSEGTAGIAAILKASLALQKSTIVPNLLLESLNPRIKPFSGQLRVATSCTPWPAVQAGQPRRASVNSFGFGGTNAHAILESWEQDPTSSKSFSDLSTTTVFAPFVFSAASEKSLKSYLKSLAIWAEGANAHGIHLRSLAHTLHTRRSRLPYATAIAARDAAELCMKIQGDDPLIVRTRPEREGRPVVLGVFTGQGAQWAGMGAELVSKSGAARDIISTLESRLARLPLQDRPQWSLLEEMQKSADCSRVGEAALSQPVCTAVQIVLVDLLRSSGVEFDAVVGHSSGEIAAAYAAGVLSAEDAICIAYYRGLHGHLAAGRQGQQGSMMAVGLSVDDASELVDSHVFRGRAVIAAYNSSTSLTLSGDRDAIQDLKMIIEDEQKFARLLVVEKAYHSHHMEPCCGPYGDSLKGLDIQVSGDLKCRWISSVTGDDMAKHPEGLEKVKGPYWVDNAAQPVLFMQAVQRACELLGTTTSDNNIHLAIEVGPHPALRGPATQTIQETTGQMIPYTGLLKRKASDVVSLAEGLGFAWSHLPKGHVHLESFDQFVSQEAPASLIKGLPMYSWDHEVDYWHQSRYAKSCLFRDKPHELLGHLTSALGIGQELRWRHILSPAEVPWLNGHRLQSQSVLPAAAYVVLAIEACRELLKLSSDLDAQSAMLIHVHNVEIHQAMTFDSDDSRVEAVFSLSDITRGPEVVSANFKYFGGAADAARNASTSLRMLASGSVQIVLGTPSKGALPSRGPRPDNTLPVKEDDFYESLRLMGYEYSGPFRALSGLERKLGCVNGLLSHSSKQDAGDHDGSELLVHPAMLDVAFQAVLLAKAAPYDGTLWSMHVPKIIKRVTVNPSACESYLARQEKPLLLPFESCQPNIMDNTFRGDVDVYPPGAVANADADQVSHAILQVEGLDCVPFSPATVEDDREPMSVMVWDYASPDAEKAAYDLSPEPDPQELELAQFLERMSFFYLQRLQRLVPVDHACRREGMPLSKLFNFARHIESRVLNGKLPFWKDEWFHDTPQIIREASRPWTDQVDYRLLNRIGENLVDIATGNTTAIEITRSDDVLGEYYSNSLVMGRHTTFLARTVQQVTHRHAHLNILEVGAGTGVATKEVLQTIGGSFSSYDFTDISSGFFPAAQQHFGAHPSFSRMAFKVLDIGSDPREQGFEPHAYDVVIASMVLHATPTLRQSLRNTRRLLRPGGYLIVHEVAEQSSDVARVGTIFGAFPGWWLGAESDGRVLGPALPLAKWNELLRETGFSGCDSSVPIIDPLLTPNTVFVSQAVDARTDFLRQPLSDSVSHASVRNHLQMGSEMQHAILIGGNSTVTSPLTHELLPRLRSHFASVQHIPSLADLATRQVSISQSTTILSLSDLDVPFSQNVTELSLQSFKQVLHNAGSVLWVTQGRRAENPFANMTVGLVRSVLIEVPTLAFQFLDFEGGIGSVSSHVIAEALLRFKAGLAWKQQGRDSHDPQTAMLMTVERELVVDKQGQVLIPRMFPAKDMNKRYNSGLRPIFGNTQLGREDGISKSLVLRRDKERGDFYLEQNEQEAHEDSDSLQVTHSLLLAYWIKGLGHAHISIARGKDDDALHLLLSNHIASTFRPLVNLPPIPIHGGATSLTDSDAKGRFLAQFALNMLAISIVADIPRGGRLLVYEPEPALAAILKEEAEDRGVKLTIVTSTMTRRRCEFLGWLLIHPQAPARAIRGILPRQASVFLVCDNNKDSQHADVANITARIMAELPSPCRTVYMTELCKREARIQPISDKDAHGLHSHLGTAILRAQHNHASSKDMRTVSLQRISEITASNFQDATVVEWERGIDLPVRIRPIDEQKLFSSNKTYWLAGLTGSLGLSLCEWMVGRGARHVVMTSRTPNVSRSWVERVASLGAVVKILSNDLTDLAQTESLYQDICSVMPPIGGVALGAMVLVDATFRNMTPDDWQTACRPKVQGAIHLDKIFHHVDLDFFLCFSSLSAVAGNPGQSNYTAANLFMASMAEQRRRRGLAASVMHIAPLLGVGYVSEKTDLTKTNFARTSGYSLQAERDVQQQFAEAVVAGRAGPVEVAMGLQRVSPNPEKPPFWFDNPTISHFISHRDTRQTSKAVERSESVKTLLLSAETWDQVHQVLQDALRPFLCSLFQIQGAAEMDDAQFLDVYLDEIGLDSLLAVEIRTWWLRTIGVSLPVMKILSGITVGQLLTSGVEGLQLSPDLVPNVRSGPADGSVEKLKEVPRSHGTETIPSGAHDDEQINNTDTLSSASGTPGDITPGIASPGTSDTSKEVMTPPKAPASLANVQQMQPVVERWTELSMSQKMFWFVRTFLDDRAGLNHTGLYRLSGPLRVEDLDRAVRRLGQRHESLRTCFHLSDDGHPRQGVMENSRALVEYRDMSDVSEATLAFEELRQYSYDLEIGECIRVILLAKSPTVHYLLLGTHTLVLDGFSLTILMQDLLRSYDGRSDGGTSSASIICQYPDFAQAQLEALEAGEFEADVQFWIKEFTPCPPPLPALTISSAPHHPVQSKYDNEIAHLRLDGATKSRVREICRRCKTRPFHFFLTVFRALLSRFADVEEVAIGIGDANRTHEGALEGLGPYINLLPLRFANDVNHTFATALRETKNKTDLALSHSRVPFQVLLERLHVHRSATQSPIFQTFFDYRQGIRERQPFGECQLELLEFDASRVPYDVALDITDDPDHDDYRLMLIVRADMYSKQDAELLLSSYQKLVHAFMDASDASFATPDVFEPYDIERALEFGRGEAMPSQWDSESVIGQIQTIAAANPDRVACKLPQGGQSMTYRELMGKCQAIAHVLTTRGGATAGSVVAVYQEPTPDWLCSVLAIFSIGAVCVPLDAGTLVERLAVMADDSKAQVLIADSLVDDQNVMVLSSHGSRKIIHVQEVQETTPAPSWQLPRAEDPAMILYTSGSTGVPKGIVLGHGGFRNWAEFVPPLYTSGAGKGPETVLLQSSIGFDMAYLEAFFALCHGGTVCIVPRAKRVDASAITDIIAAEGVTVTSGVPSEYMNWLRYGNHEALARSTTWRTILCGGEPGTTTVLELQASLGPQPPPHFFHMYGPTETSITAASIQLSYGRDNAEVATVGGPFPNYSIYVLDDQLRPVPAGVQGEIYIGGAGVAAGYLRNEALTAERFVPDPFAPSWFQSRGWSTMHRTGDKGRWHKDGSGLVIEGRRSGDTQHKLRGLRIDLQEVEKVMLKQAGGVLSQVIVTVRRTSPDSPEFLVAHAQFHPQHADSRPDITSQDEQQQFLNSLSSRLPLPQYMWPAMTVPVQVLPMMSSGKLDRRAIAALPLPETSSFVETDALDTDPVTNLTETELWLKRTWENVISKDVISSHQIVTDSDFFHVGGTSMLLLRVQAEIRQNFGFQIPLVQLFASSSLGAMARLVDQRAEAESQQSIAPSTIIDWDAETDLSTQTRAALVNAGDVNHERDPRGSPKVVVLTGATGLLGLGLLKKLLANPNIERVHCIGVRNARVRMSLLPSELKDDKVVLYEGDLTQARLGLRDDEMRTVFGSADRIIHNGADTSHLKTYESLRRANLQSTKEIVDMCLLVARRLIPIHYVSTASVLQYSGLDEFAEESASAYPPPPDAFDGYSASKWASEVFLGKVHERSGGVWPIFVHRPTSILRQDLEGDAADSEQQNQEQIVPNLLKYCKITNAVPVLPNISGVINIVALESVVESLLSKVSAPILSSPSPQGDAKVALRFLHEMGDVNIPLSNLKSYIDTETGNSAVQLPPDEWARRAAKEGMDGMLVAFFENLCNMPPVTWQRLIKDT